MIILSIFLIIISIIISCFAFYKIKNINKINTEIELKNNQLKKENEEALVELKQTENNLNKARSDYCLVTNDIANAINNLDNLHKETESVINDKEKLSNKAFENYCEILENKYKELEIEYTQNEEILKESYFQVQSSLLQEKEQIEQELEKMRKTRAATIEASLREEQVKQNLSFYCLTVSSQDKEDIEMLEKIKPRLNNPRILSMLIWSTFYQKPMTTLCNKIIGTSIKTGIYKITNQLNNQCYIGQAVDLATRWKQHAKCGLGIDTPQGNKLYQAMIEDGLYNFSFEVLEECPREQLNEKEKYYIQLYQSKEFGYNSTAGNK